MKEWQKMLLIVVIFLCAYFIPFEHPRFQSAVMESFYMLQDYARLHVMLCLVPAFFIAGAIGAFVSQASVMKYLGAGAKKIVAYSVASVSGTVLAVCSCTVLPLFAGIYRMGAGLGPAAAFLYSGPAINVLAIVLTAKVLGWEIGVARAAGAIIFSFIIGILMAFTFRKEEQERIGKMFMQDVDTPRTLLQDSIYFFSMVGILVFSNWAKPASPDGLWFAIFSHKWHIAGGFALLFSYTLIKWFHARILPVIITGLLSAVFAFIFPQYPLIAFATGIAGLSVTCHISNDETRHWLEGTWTFAKQILPLLFGGVLIAGFFLGMPGSDKGIIPSEWVSALVGGNSLFANFFASLVGAIMYFATLTEVPILQGLISSGMGKGPALALLLAGPALSLPNMIVIRSIMGTKKTVFFVGYVVILSTLAGLIFGMM